MTTGDINSRLKGWLSAQGYPLEMRTAQFFHKRGWFFHHSRRYKDPVLEKEREIDLVAFYDDPNKESPTHAHFVIECKWTPQKPWVIFTSTREATTPIGYLRAIPMTGLAKSILRPVTSEDISKLPLFFEYKEGYSVVQAFNERSATDAAYHAVQTVINAADYFAEWMSENASHSIIYIPTIILEGELFQCSLNDNGETEVEEINAGFMVFKTAEERRSVYIVRESGLSQFFDNAEQTFRSLRERLKKKG